jgi:hypothetical protein
VCADAARARKSGQFTEIYPFACAWVGHARSEDLPVNIEKILLDSHAIPPVLAAGRAGLDARPSGGGRGLRRKNPGYVFYREITPMARSAQRARG